jgi:DNA-binding transcriptional MerR regulator
MAKPRGIKDQIHALREQGLSYDKIREITGATKSTISYHVGKSGNEKIRVNEATKGRRKEIRRYIVELKEKTPCVDCARTYPFFVTQFDHLPQFMKSFAISQFHQTTLDLEVVIAEIAKCELVCGNCHAIRTHARRVDAKKRKEVYNDLLDNDYEDDNDYDDWDEDYVR